MASPAFFSGTGRRKTAIARVRLLPGEGEIVVNGRIARGALRQRRERGRRPDAVPRHRHRGPLQRDDQGRGRRRDRPGRRDPPRHRPGPARGRRRREPPAAPPGRPPDPRPADEGAQEVRAEARPQGARSTPSASAPRLAADGRVGRCAPRSRTSRARSLRCSAAALPSATPGSGATVRVDERVS